MKSTVLAYICHVCCQISVISYVTAVCRSLQVPCSVKFEQITCRNVQCSIYRGRGLGFNPPLVDDDPPPLVTAKFGLGLDLTPQRDHYSDSSSKTLFVMICRLTASLVLLLCLITFNQSFNEPVLFSMKLLCVCVIMKSLQSTSNCRCQTTAMATYTFLMYSVLCTPQAYSSPTVQLAFTAHIE